MTNWKEYKLDDLVTKLGDGLHGTPKYDPTGEYYFINGSNLLNGCISVNDNTKRVTKEEFNKYKKELTDRTIFVSINGTIGNIATYNNEKVVLGKSACYFNLKEGISKEFIKYVVTEKKFQHYITEYATGTTIKNVPLKAIREYTFNLPDLSTQTAIAEILSSLDNKIELNNQINQNLEALAQALFKQWFVDFEFPDKKGNPYKSSGGKMMESELCEIPDGWIVGKLEEVLQIKYGKDHKTLEDGSIPVYGSGGIMRYVNKSIYDKVSILIPRKGTLSNLFYINKPFWSVDTMFYSIIDKEFYVKYLFYLLKFLDLASMNVGSAVPSLTTKVLNELAILLPSDFILKKFDDALSPIFRNIEKNNIENQELGNLRDLILPKLISGALEVKAVKNQLTTA